MISARNILSKVFAVVVITTMAIVLIIRPQRISFNPNPNYKTLSDQELLNQLRSMRLPRETPLASQKNTTTLTEIFGRQLFFDPGISASNTISCATCHNPAYSFTDRKKTSAGIGLTSMNAPTLINMKQSVWFFWNGRADSLEAQALGPIENPLEHGFSRSSLVHRILTVYKLEYESIYGRIPKSIIDYESKLKGLPAPRSSNPKISDELAAYALATLGSSKFQKDILSLAQRHNVQPIEELKIMASGSMEPANEFDQLPDHVKRDINQVAFNAAHSIAEFERTIRTNDSPFDRYIDRTVIQGSLLSSLNDEFGASELSGLRLFTGRARCTLCHQGPYFTDQQFHNIGLPALTSDTIEIGRSQGLLMARDHEFNCLSTYSKNLNSDRQHQVESCRELQFLQTENSELMGAFKTPTLRNLKFTAPYGHDGRFLEINDILLHYSNLNSIPAVGHREESLVPLHLSAQERHELELFLLSLSGPISFDQE
jgi:cytochrome c peroxidase